MTPCTAFSTTSLSFTPGTATRTFMDDSFIKIEPGVFRIRPSHPGFNAGVIGKEKNKIDCSGDIAGYRPFEKALVSSITGIPEKDIVFMRQVHEDSIMHIDRPPEKNELYAGDADGLITHCAGICIMIRTADCVPVFVFDPRRGIIGAAHSGWRSARLGICRKLLEKMKSLYGSDPHDVHAFILPSIGPDSYMVKSDVGDLFPDDIAVKDDNIYLNLWQNITKALMAEGVPGKNIFNAGICTLKNSDEFYSHRAGDTGRNLNFCYMSESC